MLRSIVAGAREQADANRVSARYRTRGTAEEMEMLAMEEDSA